MNTEGGEKERFSVVPGGQYARFRNTKIEVSGPEFYKLDTDVQAAFAAMEDVSGTVPSRGVQEIREHRHRPWRVLARRFRECRDAGVPLHQSIAVVYALEQWVRDIYDADPPHNRAA